LRIEAEVCPLCDSPMTDVAGRPNTKELDHIVPLIVGGTNARENLRVICRRCNQQRPKDGSDYTGVVTSAMIDDVVLMSRAGLLCSVCQGPLRRDSKYGICHRNPQCRRAADAARPSIRGLRGEERRERERTAGRCSRCGTRLSPKAKYGVCQRNAECRAVAARLRNDSKTRSAALSRGDVKAKPHGTYGRYRQGCKCGDCRRANSEHAKLYR
jgi:hypothetical protein